MCGLREREGGTTCARKKWRHERDGGERNYAGRESAASVCCFSFCLVRMHPSMFFVLHQKKKTATTHRHHSLSQAKGRDTPLVANVTVKGEARWSARFSMGPLPVAKCCAKKPSTATIAKRPCVLLLGGVVHSKVECC